MFCSHLFQITVDVFLMFGSLDMYNAFDKSKELGERSDRSCFNTSFTVMLIDFLSFFPVLGGFCSLHMRN